MHCMLIHGFGGSVREIQSLYDHLTQSGIGCTTVVLAGHGKTKREFAESTYRMWADSAIAAYEELKARLPGEKIVVAGFSMGALMALQINAVHPLDALVTINGPIYFWDKKRILKNIAEDLRTRQGGHIEKYISSCRKTPYRSLGQFLVLLRKTRPLVGGVCCKTFVAQAKDDDTVQWKSGVYLKNNVSGPAVLRLYEGGGHQILQSEFGPLVCRDVENFVRGI